MEGTMLMVGAHRRGSAGTAEEVPGCVRAWADRYNPSGKQHSAVTESVLESARSASKLERELVPEAAAARRALAEILDPDKKFRVTEGDAESTAFSMSLTTGYVVEPRTPLPPPSTHHYHTTLPPLRPPCLHSAKWGRRGGRKVCVYVCVSERVCVRREAMEVDGEEEGRRMT